MKSRFMKLNSGHIQYVLDCLRENTTDVHNIKQYLLAALYNASTTISSYYQAKEVCIRLAKGRALYSEQPLSSPAATLDVMRREMSRYDREVLCVVNMNSRLQPINFNIVSVGDINTSIAAIPNIMKSGLMTNAGSFLLLHNHPCGSQSRTKIRRTKHPGRASCCLPSRSTRTSTAKACGLRSQRTEPRS